MSSSGGDRMNTALGRFAQQLQTENLLNVSMEIPLPSSSVLAYVENELESFYSRNSKLSEQEKSDIASKGVKRAAKLIREATAILITSGAGLSVESGMPDYRDIKELRASIPIIGRSNLCYKDIANPIWFIKDPAFAWGFWMHRYHQIARMDLSESFSILERIARRTADKHGYFVYTSNDDGFFSRVFPEAKVLECNGSVHYAQCIRGHVCKDSLWPLHELVNSHFTYDKNTLRASSPLPRCKNCNSIARPNVLMFDDLKWNNDRYLSQSFRYSKWQQELQNKKGADLKLVVIELGAGKGGWERTVKFEGERMADYHGGTVIRIDPNEYHVPRGSNRIAIPMRPIDALRAIEKEVNSVQKP